MSVPWNTPELRPVVRAILRANALAAALAVPGVLLSLGPLAGWRGAVAALAPGMVLAVLLNLRPGGALVRNLTLFGLAAGFTELAADAWLVHGTGTLLYPPDEPKLWASPIYMPIAWFGVLGVGNSAALLAGPRLSMAATCVVTAAVMGTYVPLYEAVAALAGWWRYEHTPMLAGVVPGYILLGEVLLALPLPLMVGRMTRAGPGEALALGVAEGIWIGLSYFVGVQLVAVAA